MFSVRTPSHFKRRTNRVSTTSYSLLSFLPARMFRECTKSYNIFFLFMCCIVLIPGLTKFSRSAYILCVIMIISVNILKAAVQEMRKYAADQKINTERRTVIRNRRISEINREDINTAERILIRKGESVPVDILLLGAYKEDRVESAYSEIYIETSALDGETSLKIRKTVLRIGETGEVSQTDIERIDRIEIEYDRKRKTGRIREERVRRESRTDKEIDRTNKEIDEKIDRLDKEVDRTDKEVGEKFGRKNRSNGADGSDRADELDRANGVIDESYGILDGLNNNSNESSDTVVDRRNNELLNESDGSSEKFGRKNRLSKSPEKTDKTDNELDNDLPDKLNDEPDNLLDDLPDKLSALSVLFTSDSIIPRGAVIYSDCAVVGFALGGDSLVVVPVRIKGSLFMAVLSILSVYTIIVYLSLLLVSSCAACWFMIRSEWLLGRLSYSIFGGSIRSLFSNVIIFSSLIPLSLFVTLDGLRVAYSVFVHFDPEMAVNNLLPVCNVHGLLEDVGMITHLLSDKTGTLTMNKMDFQGVYLPMMECPVMFDASPDEIVRMVERESSLFILLTLLLCHSVDVVDGKYVGVSQEEVCMLEYIRPYGLEVLSRREGEVVISVSDFIISCSVISTLPFTPAVARMSISVLVGGRVFLLTKGSDEVVNCTGAQGVSGEYRALFVLGREITKEEIEQYGIENKEGVISIIQQMDNPVKENTLGGIARRVQRGRKRRNEEFRPSWVNGANGENGLSRVNNERNDGANSISRAYDELNDELTDELNELNRTNTHDNTHNNQLNTTNTHDNPSNTVNNVTNSQNTLNNQLNNTPALSNYSSTDVLVSDLSYSARSVSSLSSLPVSFVLSFEVSSSYAGTLYIKDVLQAGATETVRRIRSKGISVWMLTGDRRESAISCGVAAGLFLGLDSEMAYSGSELVRMIEDGVDRVVDQSVIVFRCSPDDKKRITKYLRKCGNIVLAVGDGNNDVGMIEEADIGVGVYSTESALAAVSADLVVPSFYGLGRLIFVHGPVSLARLKGVFMFFVFKSTCLAVCQCVYGVFVGASGSIASSSLFLLFFNSLITTPLSVEMGLFRRVCLNRSICFCFLYGVLYGFGAFFVVYSLTGSAVVLGVDGGLGGHSVVSCLFSLSLFISTMMYFLYSADSFVLYSFFSIFISAGFFILSVGMEAGFRIFVSPFFFLCSVYMVLVGMVIERGLSLARRKEIFKMMNEIEGAEE